MIAARLFFRLHLFQSNCPNAFKGKTVIVNDDQNISQLISILFFPFTDRCYCPANYASVNSLGLLASEDITEDELTPLR
jgi:hypothetical protein